jgi:hypothetical protein
MVQSQQRQAIKKDVKPMGKFHRHKQNFANRVTGKKVFRSL